MASERVTRALGQRGERGRHPGDRLVDQSGRNRDDVAGALLQHLGGGALCDVEEAGDVDRQVVVVVCLGEFDEWLGDEDAGVVDQRVHAPKARPAPPG
jgi:hypothetical protein